AVAGAKDRLVVQPIDGADPRREAVLWSDEPHVLGIPADAADEDIKCLPIHHFDLAIDAVHDRVILPPHPEVQRQLRFHRPSVAKEHRMLPLAPGEELVLVALAGSADEAE